MIEEKNKFPGFPSGPAQDWWPYPRVLNGFWHTLTGGEQKVLDYILRHTWGFRKTVDFISFTQFAEGIKGLDKGTGLGLRAVANAIRGLQKKGFVRVVKDAGKTNSYQLVQKGKGSSAKRKGVGSAKRKDTIEDITKEDRQKRESARSKFSSLKSLGETEFQHLSEQYQVPIAFVRNCYDSLTNYCEAHGRRYKNYLAALRNFVKQDALKIRKEASQYVSKRGIDARNIA